MSNLTGFYTKIRRVLDELHTPDNLRTQWRQPKLSDKGVIALSLAAECCSIDSERHLFKQLPNAITGLIERSVYNRRRRALHHSIETLRQHVVQCLDTADSQALFLIDSMPVEVCKLARARRSRICKETLGTAPDVGFCAAQKMWYHGYKLHAVCSSTGVLQTLDLSAASVHDIHYLHDVKSRFSNCVLVGDKGYLSQQWQMDLWAERRITLRTPARKNQVNRAVFPVLFRKTRKRIETVFSQLCDQFMIRRNYAKSFGGLAARILCKITAFTLIQWMNRKENRPINNVKIAFT